MIYKLYWRDGKSELAAGDNIADAFRRAGLSSGAMASLDFYSENPDDEYVFNKNTREWDKVKK